MTRTARVSLSVSVVVVLGAACSSGGSGAKTAPDSSSTTVPGGGSTTSAGATTAPGASTTSSQPSLPTTTVVPGFETLAGLLLTTVPARFALLPDRVADTGPTNLAKAIEDEVAPHAADVLRTTGFVRGYQRAWSDAAAERQDTVFLYQFATAAGATQYAANRAGEIVALGARGPIKTFAVLLPGAIGLHSETVDSSFAVVTVAKGVYAIQATVTDGTNKDQSLDASALAAAQFQRLP